MFVNMLFVKRLVQVIDPSCCTPVLEPSLDASGAERLAAALGVLADPARLRLLNLVAAGDPSGSCVCNLTPAIGLSQPTVSHHLKVLTDAGLLEREQRGKWAYFRLRPEPLALLADALRVPVPA
jgi:ArsR family transcriptional regulator